MKLTLKIAAGVFLGIMAAILVVSIFAIPVWLTSNNGTESTKQLELENERELWDLETPTQRKGEEEIAKRLANMTPNQLIAACGQPDKITSKKEAEDTLQTLEYNGDVEMGFRYPNDHTQTPYLGSTDTIPDYSIGSWGWGQEMIIQLPCVKKIVQIGR